MKKTFAVAAIALVAVVCALAVLIAQNPEEHDEFELRRILIGGIEDAVDRQDLDLLSLLSAAVREVDTIHSRIEDSSLSRELSDLGLSEHPLPATGSVTDRIDHLAERLTHPVAVAHALALLGLGNAPDAEILDLEDHFDSVLRRFDDFLKLFDEDSTEATELVSRAWGVELTEAAARAQVENIRMELENAQGRLETDPTFAASAFAKHLENNPAVTAQILVYSETLRDHRDATAITSTDSDGLTRVESAAVEFGLCILCVMVQAFADIPCENAYGMCMIAAKSAGAEVEIPADASEELREAREEIKRLRVELAEERCETNKNRCLEGNANKAKLCCLMASAIPF